MHVHIHVEHMHMQELGMMLCAYNSSSGDMKAGGSEVQGHSLSVTEKETKQAGDVPLLVGCLPSGHERQVSPQNSVKLTWWCTSATLAFGHLRGLKVRNTVSTLACAQRREA